MTTPTKFDVLLQLHFLKECTFEELIDSFSIHARFENLSRRNLLKILRKLEQENFIKLEKNLYRVTYESQAKQLLAFLFWCRKDSIDFNTLLKNRLRIALEKVVGKSQFEIEDLGFSRVTSFKYFKLLRDANFFRVIKKKPMKAVFNVNDRTLHYPFTHYVETRFLKQLENSQRKHINAFSQLKIPHSRKFRDMLACLHVYSSTVTEGNTASESEVERVVHNLSTKLTPKEVIEIKNVKDAIDYMIKEKTTELSIEYIKKLHNIVMRGLIENPGKFETSGHKRILGSTIKLSTNLDSIQFSIDSMMDFYKRNKKEINPIILACILHIWFVTVHPFIDGNGRVARLIHSKILMDNGLPLFVFDPNERNRYFDSLEKSRNTSMETFLEFALREHLESIKDIKDKQWPD